LTAPGVRLNRRSLPWDCAVFGTNATLFRCFPQFPWKRNPHHGIRVSNI
jgi:hypothetical protein